MSIRKISCYVVECDGCRDRFDDDGEGDAHFDSPDYALRYVTEHHGWRISDNGRIHCPRCHDCGENGHQWGAWTPCACRGWIPEHFFTGCPLLRACRTCGHAERAALADLPTVGEPITGN